MSEFDRPIKLRNIFNDGCEEVSFVHVRERGKDKIGFALKDRNGESHSEIYELGVEDEFFSGEVEPSGGGIFNAQNGNYIRGSAHYGGPEERIQEFMSRKLPSIVDC